MPNSTTTDVLASNIDPFAFKDSHVSARGTRIYWAVTWLDSATPNGRYEIEKLSASMWSVTHYQVMKGGEQKFTRHIGPADSKQQAMRLAQLDSNRLGTNIASAFVKGHGLISA
ncbi:hypothetical protein MYRNA_30 [Mycobacterium phage Myrna]|uniref:Uncharacterized protein n=1 Tax=Mycobacterium phage Myrna TaxID=546805 RepID=B5LJ41_9CAUD|nr:gp30 [Mycobacterium phage Myrna]ACH62038.1 hypothetical protein MYRNA_30 [Mycobacterium phage Myrna]